MAHMEYPTRVKDTTTSEGTGNIACDNAPPITYRALGERVAVGESFPYGIIHRTVNEWELGKGTMLSATTFSRAPTDSSNNGSLVAFSAGVKDIICALGGDELAKVQRTSELPYSAAIPLHAPGNAYMPQQNAGGPVTFTVGANPARDSLVYLPWVADGVPANAPVINGFMQHTGSGDYDNRPGILNIFQFFYDGQYFWWAVHQAVGAQAIDNVPPTILSAAVANATPSVVRLTISEAINSAYPCAASAVTVGGHASAAGNVTVSGTYVDVPLATPFVYGEAARTLLYTQPGTNNLRDLAGNLLGTTSTPIAITNNVAAPATVPATMAAPVATAGQLSASVAFALPANGGSPITNVTIVASTGQTASGMTSPIAITMPGGVAATFTAYATNAVGNGVASPASNSVTPSSAATVPAAPTIGTAVAGDGYIDVAFSRNSDGGSAVLDSTATLSTGQTATGTTSPIRVTAPNGTPATATVKDRNAIGLSAASAASNSVTPAAASGGTINGRLINLVHLTESGASAPFGYVGDGTAITSAHGGVLATTASVLLSLASGASGRVEFTNLSTGDVICGLNSSSAIDAYQTWTHGIFGQSGGQYRRMAMGANGSAGSQSPAANDVVAIDVNHVGANSNTITLYLARAATPTTFVQLYQWTAVVDAQRYLKLLCVAGSITNLKVTGFA